tara:strand:+ start:20 stop:1003 length:984 start_codon:yes stop_codon:yes gene_type:complete
MESLVEEKIMIAGANGMVGNAIYRAFCELNIISFQKKILIPSRKELDLSNYKIVDEWFSNYKPNIVILAAAKVGGIYANNNYPADFLLENLKIQTNLIEISHKYKVKKLLFLGSSCVYPKHAKQPIIEEELLEGKLEVTSEYYSIAKIAGIKLCESLKLQYGLNAICLIPPNLFGPRDNYHPKNSHVLPSLIKKFSDAKEKNSDSVTCWGTGHQLREFMFVDDLADACLYALENWDLNKKNAPKDKFGNSLSWLNVGSDIEISIKDLSNKIAELIGFKGKINWDENMPNGNLRKKLNSKRFQSLGWKPKTTLDEGLLKTINDFRKNY